VSVLKATGHISHIQNLGSDKDAIQAMAQRHKVGQSQQNASHTLVAPNGAQLEEVLGLLAAGKVKLEVAKVGALQDQTRGCKGGAAGKVKLEVVKVGALQDQTRGCEGGAVDKVKLEVAFGKGGASK
jgi:hypothetical protein